MTSEEARSIQRASAKAASWTADRDLLIRQAHANGASLRDIATASGTLTHSAIARIVKRTSGT